MADETHTFSGELRFDATGNAEINLSVDASPMAVIHLAAALLDIAGEMGASAAPAFATILKASLGVDDSTSERQSIQ